MDRNTQSLVLFALCTGCIILGFNVWSLKKVNTSLESDKIEFAMQSSVKSREVGNKEEVIQKLKSELDSQKALNAKTQQEKRILGDKVKSMESASKKKAVEVSTLKKNVEQLKNEKKKLDNNVEQLKNEKKKLDNNVSQKMKQIDTLEEEINNKNIEIENMKNDTIAKETEIDNLRNDIESKVHEHENLKNEIVSKLIPPTEVKIENEETEVKIENEETHENVGATEDGGATFAATMAPANGTDENESSFYSYNASGSSYSSALNN